MDKRLRDSYQACREVVCASGSNFALAFWLLPRAKCQAMHALYAFARQTDELGDGGKQSVEERAVQLEQWRHQLLAALAGEPTGSPILPALADTAGRYQISDLLLQDLINGVERDLTQTRYETWEELAEYCYQVAGSVGLCCLDVWGTLREPPPRLALACGEAFQLTNILRDVAEDAQRGRVYLPLEDLRRANYRIEDLLAGRANPCFDRLMDQQLGRATALYDEAAPLHDYLTRDGRRVYRLMFGRYRAILRAIAAEPRAVLFRRIGLSLASKLSIAARQLWATRP